MKSEKEIKKMLEIGFEGRMFCKKCQYFVFCLKGYSKTALYREGRVPPHECEKE